MFRSPLPCRCDYNLIWWPLSAATARVLQSKVVASDPSWEVSGAARWPQAAAKMDATSGAHPTAGWAVHHLNSPEHPMILQWLMLPVKNLDTRRQTCCSLCDGLWTLYLWYAAMPEGQRSNKHWALKPSVEKPISRWKESLYHSHKIETNLHTLYNHL